MSQWADEKRILGDTSPEPGPWRTSRVPYAREIMDCLSPANPVQEVVFCGGTQIAKTEIGNNWLGFIVDVAPGPTMFVMPTGTAGSRSSATRLADLIDSTPAVGAKLADTSRDSSNTAKLKKFPGGVLAIASANSAADLKSMPCRYIFMDEIDEYSSNVDGQGPAVQLAEKRASNFVRRKVYKCSTPTVRGKSNIDKAYEASDKRRYFVPCPHCRGEQVLKWEGMRWELARTRELVCSECAGISELGPEHDGAAGCGHCGAVVTFDAETVRERETDEILEYWYECEHCVERIYEHYKTQMLEGGRWIATAPGPRKAAGFHLSALYSPLGWFSWLEAIEKRLEADKDPTGELRRTWDNTVLAVTYVEAHETPSDLGLKERAESYRLRTVPAGGLMLTAFTDVQANRLETQVTAWGRGEESWIVDYQVIYGDTETSGPWLELDEFLQTTYPHEWGGKLQIIAAGVDAGFRTQTVYDFCRRRSHRHIFPTKGQSQAGKAVLGRPTAQDVDHKGEKIPGGVMLWPIGADTAKARIYARLQIGQLTDEERRRGAVPVTGGPGFIHFPAGLSDDYYKGLVSERQVTRYVKGYARRVWEKDAGARNEPLDLMVGCYAAAIYAGVSRMNWDRVEAAHRAASSDLFVAAERARELEQAKGAEAGAADDAATDAAPKPAARPQTPAPAPVVTDAPRTEAPARSGWIRPRADWLRR